MRDNHTASLAAHEKNKVILSHQEGGCKRKETMLVTFRTVKGESFQLEFEEDATVCVLVYV